MVYNTVWRSIYTTQVQETVNNEGMTKLHVLCSSAITNIPNRSDVLQLKFSITLLIFSTSVSPLQHWDISQTKIRVISTLLFVLFGCLLFVALPAAIFKHIEGWSALESLYFVVITLTTIGFGDFVAGTNTASEWMPTLNKKNSFSFYQTHQVFQRLTISLCV